MGIDGAGSATTGSACGASAGAVVTTGGAGCGCGGLGTVGTGF
jgi:hypothetical protein